MLERPSKWACGFRNPKNSSAVVAPDWSGTARAETARQRLLRTLEEMVAREVAAQ